MNFLEIQALGRKQSTKFWGFIVHPDW